MAPVWETLLTFQRNKLPIKVNSMLFLNFMLFIYLFTHCFEKRSYHRGLCWPWTHTHPPYSSVFSVLFCLSASVICQEAQALETDRMENAACGEGLCHGRLHSPVGRYKWYQSSMILNVKKYILIYIGAEGWWSQLRLKGDLSQHSTLMPSRNKAREVWADEEPDTLSVTFSYLHHI